MSRSQKALDHDEVFIACPLGHSALVSCFIVARKHQRKCVEVAFCRRLIFFRAKQQKMAL
jgi:hypothetical protein